MKWPRIQGQAFNANHLRMVIGNSIGVLCTHVTPKHVKKWALSKKYANFFNSHLILMHIGSMALGVFMLTKLEQN